MCIFIKRHQGKESFPYLQSYFCYKKNYALKTRAAKLNLGHLYLTLLHQSVWVISLFTYTPERKIHLRWSLQLRIHLCNIILVKQYKCDFYVNRLTTVEVFDLLTVLLWSNSWTVTKAKITRVKPAKQIAWWRLMGCAKSEITSS